MFYTLTQEEYDALKKRGDEVAQNLLTRKKVFDELLQFLCDEVKTRMQGGHGAFGDRYEPVISPRQLQKVLADAREKFVEKS
jgi:hypothetical protein